MSRSLIWLLALGVAVALPGAGLSTAAAAKARTSGASTRVAAPLPRVAWIERCAAERDTTGLAQALRGEAVAGTRAVAARALGRIGDRSGVPPLIAALRDPSAEVRGQAAFALGLIGDSTAAPALGLRWEKERDLLVRQTLLTSMGLIGASGSAPYITRALSAKSQPERWSAALAAGRLRNPALTSPLRTHVDESRPEMRWRVAYALGRIGNPGGAPALRTLARDASEIVRYHAARGLGEVLDSTSVEVLTSLLKDPAWRVRVNAAHALGALGARNAGKAVASLLRDPSAHVRWEAALALGAMRDSTAAPALMRALSDSSVGVVQGAATALLRIQGERAIPTIAPELDLLPGFLRSGLVEALGPIPGTMALQTLIARARDTTDVPQAQGAISALAGRKDDAKPSIAVLRELLKARDFTIVSSAADALAQLGDSTSAPELAALLARFGTTEDADIRASAAGALATLKTKDALAALGNARRDPERRIRETVCAALGLPPDSIGLVKNPLLRSAGGMVTPATALIRTTKGVVVIALDHTRAPLTVENFVRLARSKYFDGITFHRVVPNFVVQAGCPRGDGWGGPGYEIPCEYNDRPYAVGTVGMALSGKDTGGSQWFVTLSPQPRLEGRYTVFGEVKQGMDVVERIMPGDRILSVTFR